MALGTADPTAQYIAVDEMDGYAIPCPADIELVQEEGSFSGPLMHAVSAVAEMVADEFSGKIVSGATAWAVTGANSDCRPLLRTGDDRLPSTRVARSAKEDVAAPKRRRSSV